MLDFDSLSLSANAGIFLAAAACVWIAGSRLAGGVMLSLLLAVALAGVAAGEPLGFMGIGLTPVLLLAGYLVIVRLSRPGDFLPRWRATNEPQAERQREPESAVGIVVTCILLIGLLDRRDRTVKRMGVDSLAVLIAYTSGLVGLYALR